MIGFYKMSLIGRSHESAENGECQDACDAKILKNGWVVAAIADGVGSAKHSKSGSEIAVREALHVVVEGIPGTWHQDGLVSLLKTAYQSAFNQIDKQAEQDKHSVNDFDTTLTMLIYNGENAVYGHVGDGGIIALDAEGEFSVLTEAQKGDEFNSVVPLRFGPKKWIFHAPDKKFASFLMMTDGIYDIVCPWLLAKKEQKIWLNYARRFMDRNMLPVNTQADFNNAEKEISEVFKSDETKYITDDKTIVGIINTEILPKVRPDEYYAEPDWENLSATHKEKLYGTKTKSKETSEKALPANDISDKKFEKASENSFAVEIAIKVIKEKHEESKTVSKQTTKSSETHSPAQTPLAQKDEESSATENKPDEESTQKGWSLLPWKRKKSSQK
jgi:hypothetical protein